MTSDHRQPNQRHPDQGRPDEGRPEGRPDEGRPDQPGAALPAGLTTRPAIIRDAQTGGDVADELPGDPACLLRRVCQNCGGVAGADPPAVCPHCGAELPGT